MGCVDNVKMPAFQTKTARWGGESCAEAQLRHPVRADLGEHTGNLYITVGVGTPIRISKSKMSLPRTGVGEFSCEVCE